MPVAWTVETLVRHLLDDHHAPLRERLPAVSALAAEVVTEHASDHPVLFEIRRVWEQFREELEAHLDKEESELFPHLLEGRRRSAIDEVMSVRFQHDDAALRISMLRELADGYGVPEDAGAAWRKLWAELQQLEVDLKEHVHLEEGVLFPMLWPKD